MTSSDDLTGVSHHDVIEHASVGSMGIAIFVGLVAVIGLIPSVYAHYAAGAFTIAYASMLFWMAFLVEKNNGDEEVMSDASAVVMFSLFQILPVSFLVGRPMDGFKIFLGLFFVLGILGAILDTAFNPKEEGEEAFEEFSEDIMGELREAASSDEYEVPDNPEEILDDR